MAASFPGSVKIFTPKSPGVDKVQASHINELQDEITAIETHLMARLRDDGWKQLSIVPVYGTSTSVRFNSIDLTQLFPVGTKIKLVQGGTTKYFYVIAVSFAGGNTTLTLEAGSDYSVANSNIAAFYFSHGTAFGFPEWFNWTPDLTQSGATTLTNTTVSKACFRIDGKSCFILLDFSGTLGGTAEFRIWFRSPVTAAAGGTQSLVNMTYKNPSTSRLRQGFCYSDTNGVVFHASKYDASEYTLGSIIINVYGRYRI